MVGVFGHEINGNVFQILHASKIVHVQSFRRHVQRVPVLIPQKTINGLRSDDQIVPAVPFFSRQQCVVQTGPVEKTGVAWLKFDRGFLSNGTGRRVTGGHGLQLRVEVQRHNGPARFIRVGKNRTLVGGCKRPVGLETDQFQVRFFAEVPGHGQADRFLLNAHPFLFQQGAEGLHVGGAQPEDVQGFQFRKVGTVLR